MPKGQRVRRKDRKAVLLSQVAEVPLRLIGKIAKALAAQYSAGEVTFHVCAAGAAGPSFNLLHKDSWHLDSHTTIGDDPMPSTLSFENPVFWIYALAASIMLLKLLLQPWMTVARMMKVRARAC